MAFKVIFEGDEQDEVFETEAEARDYAGYLCSCADLGGEILSMSNPGDYDYDEYNEYDYEIVEVDDIQNNS